MAAKQSFESDQQTGPLSLKMHVFERFKIIAKSQVSEEAFHLRAFLNARNALKEAKKMQIELDAEIKKNRAVQNRMRQIIVRDLSANP